MDILGPRSQTLGTWLAFLLAALWIVYELRKDDQLPTGATMSNKLLPILLMATLFITAGMHLIAAIINWRQSGARARDNPQGVDQLSPAPVVSESARLIELRDDLDAMRRERDTTQANLETCLAEQKQTLKKLDECESNLRHWKDEVRRVKVSCDSEKQTLHDLWVKSQADANNLQQKLDVVNAKLDDLRIPSGQIQLEEAWYFVPGEEANRLNVRAELQSDIDNRSDGTLWLGLDQLYQEQFRPDPHDGVEKVLQITYLHRSNRFSITVRENTRIRLPLPYNIVYRERSTRELQLKY